MTRLIHIINPVKIGNHSDLHIAEPITFKSFKLARDYYDRPEDIIQLSAQFSEDRDYIPEHIIKTSPDLDRSILNSQLFSENKKKLPFIGDILNRAYVNSSSGDYIIYTNVDIGLMPFFYSFIFEKIANGIDSMVINRRSVSNQYSSPNQLIDIYSDVGNIHPGFDCFVFPRESFQQFKLEDACIGANWIGRVIIANLIGSCRNFRIFKNEHLTFHIGEDGEWQTGKFNVYDEHNKKIAYRVINWWLKKEITSDKRHLLIDFLKHMDSWQEPYKKKNTRLGLLSRVKRRIRKIVQ